MEKFFLGTFFTGNELDIIHQKDINVSVFASELLVLIITDGVDQLIGEFLTGHIEDFGFVVVFQYEMSH